MNAEGVTIVTLCSKHNNNKQTQQQQQQQQFEGPLSGNTQVKVKEKLCTAVHAKRLYQKKHSPNSYLSCSSAILHQLPPYTMIHSILPVKFTCMTVFSHNLSPRPLWCWNHALNTLYPSSPNHGLPFQMPIPS